MGKGEQHRLCKTTEYQTWKHMTSRCYNKNNYDYKHYGGRGITVCAEWKKSFTSFLCDMGLKPSEKHSIDRIDNNKGYCKENCKWSTQTEQVINRRANKRPRHALPRGVDLIKPAKNGMTINKYQSSICIHYKKYHLGSFPTPELAHKEYRKVFHEWYGKWPIES